MSHNDALHTFIPDYEILLEEYRSMIPAINTSEASHSNSHAKAPPTDFVERNGTSPRSTDVRLN